MREGKNEKNGDWKVGIFIVSFSLAMGISIWASAAVGHNEANNNPPDGGTRPHLGEPGWNKGTDG